MSKEDVSFRAMLAYKTFQKSGRVPDVEFMDSYTVRKAADETDFNEMADTYSRKNRLKELEASSPKSGSKSGAYDVDPFDIEYADVYADAMRGNIETDADFDAEIAARRKENAGSRKEASKIAQPYGHAIARTVDAASSTSMPEEEKAKYLFNQPEALGKKVKVEDYGRGLIPSDFYNAIDGIVNSHLSDISNEKRAEIAKELYDIYKKRFFNASTNSTYL